MLIAVGIGLGCWLVAGIWLFAPGIHYWRLSRQSERAGNLLEASVRLVGAVALFIVGLDVLAAVLDGGQIATLVFGPAFLGGAFWVLRHYRRNWRRFASGNHRMEVLLHLAGITALPVIGIVILAVGL